MKIMETETSIPVNEPTQPPPPENRLQQLAELRERVNALLDGGREL